ncbi:DUF6777 domain-containing protein [Streptomyces sp. NPDC051954]|uniref:DUF6777 domain-containing protein n=1 Tax=unclassified Streptomyces TaxID=2593676 RepID=UPI003416F2E5
MRLPIRTVVMACVLSAILFVAGCGDTGGDTDRAAHATRASQPSGELFLQPAAARGPDPFTASTATSTATPPTVVQPASSTPTGSASALPGVRSFSGGTPGLYGGRPRQGSCDLNRQIALLAADRTKAGAFARVTGVSEASVPSYARGLTPVVLRADTRVTNHGYRSGRATGYQSVLQAGTAVLVDNRGVPRVRCACGNPLRPPVAMRGTPGTNGRPWSGYRPAQVVVVAPAPRIITDITIVSTVDNTWIERRVGHDVRHDRRVPPPRPVTPTPPRTSEPTPTPPPSESGASPGEESRAPSDRPSDGQRHSPEESATVTATPPTSEPESPPEPPDVTTTPPEEKPDSPPDTSPETSQSPVSPDEVGPETVPDTPDAPDGGGLVPDEPESTDIILGSPTDVFGG